MYMHDIYMVYSIHDKNTYILHINRILIYNYYIIVYNILYCTVYNTI